MANLSPMMQQYLDIKSQHKDHVLFFRLGDFYEMFFNDAINISKELELTLTGRDCGMPERAPMCGIPYHSSEGYIKKLIEKGYKVAICEQVENPADVTKGIVKREVIRVVTPGTVIENSLLSEEQNNYIASIIIDNKAFAICFADISTGDVYLTEQKTSNVSVEVITELSKFMPTEILFNENLVSLKEIGEFIKNKLSTVCEMYDNEVIENSVCINEILNHFKGQTLEDLSLTEKPLAMKALGGLINYVNKTQKNGAQRIVKVNIYKENQYMGIDITAKRNLEITKTMRSGEKRGTLLWVLDKTKTAMGKRYIRKALEQPLVSLSEITRRQNAVQELYQNSFIREELAEALTNVYDLERLMTRVVYGSVSPREIRALAFTISHLPKVKEIANRFQCNYLSDVNANLNTLEEVYALIDNAIVDEPPITLKDGGVIKTGFHSQLDEYRDLCNNAKGYIANIEEKQREETGIKNLKISYNRVFGYYIEVTKSNLDMVPETYIRKQTLANCERYITQELKDLETKVLSASDKIQALEAEIFDEIRKFVASKIDEIQQSASAIAKLDFILSLATVAQNNNYVCPTIQLSGEITIKDGRHPVVEQMLKDSLFVPNDTLLDNKENKMLIITGPNMAGKSTYMRQVAVITIMAQIGSFVPASSATISICDKIFTRVGASDDLAAGQSTFMVEMSEVAHILKNATSNSLVILDEIGRGTSTFDGMSIAKAVVSYIAQNKKLGCKTLFATHYHELTAMENEIEGVKNYNIAVKKRGDDITFLRKIIRGGADDSYGIEVAKLAGIPQAVVTHAKQILGELEHLNPEIKFVKNESKENDEIEFSQMSFESESNHIIIDKLNDLQIDTLTPIEALNVLYELKKLV
ncbi:DNA mismatch repair protein MutS [Paludicola sp. MB14-C6]|uniref:DNA mismatch repair protein MutS n=1 Tax=Paludihabitans sp. MB14-C6 TaxID=3070656 RepID=UPI0027DE0459|nr:DNA mismatch repair protein MutS [Paludicola sp. MB14-C6]WMJ23105.1 DNA mismatch repair protein MutS [Paludicola sp. MB14-C6]